MKAQIRRVGFDFEIGEFGHQAWNTAEEICIDTYWSGETAPAGRHFKARLLWSDSSLYVQFEANLGEPAVVSVSPHLGSKTLGLWDRDVCEIFVAPDVAEPRRYFEFEIAPNGEWVDLAVLQLPDRRETDWEYASGMSSAVESETDRCKMAVKIPWPAFSRRPADGDVWLGNIFRCVGTDPGRGYLAWSPTFTGNPNFHVPARFGEFRFTS